MTVCVVRICSVILKTSCTMKLFFLILAMAIHSQVITVESASECSNSNYPCLWNQEKTQPNCMSMAPYCVWCNDSLTQQKKCQTVDRSCLVTNTWEISGILNEAACDAADGIYCDGNMDTKCIYPEYAYRICHRPGGLNPCVGNNKKDCQNAGCVWCDGNSLTQRANLCWKMPDEAKCDPGTTCCREQHCMVGLNPDETDCLNMGCHICEDTDGNKYCNFGPEPPCPECPSLPLCPADAEDCSAGTTKELCEDLCCSWCTEDNQAMCKRTTYDEGCSATTFTSCPTSGGNDLVSCGLLGCTWCSGVGTQCIEGSTCVSCNCLTPKMCCGKTKWACEENGCLWCEETSTKPAYCIHADNEGIPRDDMSTYSECSRTCGSGTRWKNIPCVDGICRQYSTCNAQPCAKEVCDEGELPRYGHQTGTCCMTQTSACGQNTISWPSSSVNGKRKKRVVGGVDATSISRWPWVVRVVHNSGSECTGTLISNLYVVTAATCFLNGHVASDIIVKLGSYDKDEAAEVEVSLESMTVHQDIIVLKLNQTVPFGSCVQPICMPNGEKIQDDWTCAVVGWGRTDPSDPSSTVTMLRETVVRVSQWEMCEEAWGAATLATGSAPQSDMHVCAGIPEGGKDECYGDDGGPLMCQRCENCGWFLAGVATEYVGCGKAQNSTIFARMDFYESMIAANYFAPLDPGTYESC